MHSLVASFSSMAVSTWSGANTSKDGKKLVFLGLSPFLDLEGVGGVLVVHFVVGGCWMWQQCVEFARSFFGRVLREGDPSECLCRFCGILTGWN